jgi:hypothetical protein
MTTTRKRPSVAEESYQLWRAAAEEAGDALAAWCRAPHAAKRSAYTVYRAAADREDTAAAAFIARAGS